MRTHSRRTPRDHTARGGRTPPIPRAIIRALVHGPELPPASALAMVLNVIGTHRAPAAALDALRGRVIVVSVAGHASDCRIALTRSGFAPRTRRAHADLVVTTGPYELYLLARGLVGADELIHAGRLQMTGEQTVRAGFLRVLACLDWTALPAGSRKSLDGLANLHMRWRH